MMCVEPEQFACPVGDCDGADGMEYAADRRGGQAEFGGIMAPD